MEIWKNIGQSFYCQGLADHKILWDSRTLKDLGISILKKVKAFQLNFWQKSRWCWSNKNTKNGEVAFSTCCLLQSKCLCDLNLLLLCCPLWKLGTLINQIPVVEIRHIFAHVKGKLKNSLSPQGSFSIIHTLHITFYPSSAVFPF